MKKYSGNAPKTEVAHRQCVKYHFHEFEYKGIKILELHITQTRYPESVADGWMDSWMDWATRPAFRQGEEVNIIKIRSEQLFFCSDANTC